MAFFIMKDAIFILYASPGLSNVDNEKMHLQHNS